jgi:hypothetical protein
MLIDTLEGTVGPDVWFHLDLTGDVLHLALIGTGEIPSRNVETSEGWREIRTQEGDELVGVILDGWGKRHGGLAPDNVLKQGERLEALIDAEAARFAEKLTRERANRPPAHETPAG